MSQRLWDAAQKHWVVALSVSLGVLVGASVNFAAGFITVWEHFSSASIPEFAANRRWAVTGWMQGSTMLSLVGMFVSVAAIAVMVALLKEAKSQRRTAIELKTARREMAAVKSGFARDFLIIAAAFRIQEKQPEVTIRYVGHGRDYELVMRIESVLRDCVNWTITLDGTNSPPLRPDSRFKVMFDVPAMIPTPLSVFGMTLHAFHSGELLAVPVGERRTERADLHRLVIEVLPDGL